MRFVSVNGIFFVKISDYKDTNIFTIGRQFFINIDILTPRACVDGVAMVTFDATPTNDQDNVPVWLEYVPVGGVGTTVLTETVEANKRTEAVSTEYGSTVRYDHGRFSAVGNDGYVITINESNEYHDAIDWNTYANSRTTYITLRLVFNNKYYQYTYTFPSGNTSFVIDYSELH